MKKLTKTAGLLFIAAASVYTSQAIVAATGTGASSKTVAAAAPTTLASRQIASDGVVMGAPGDNTNVKLIDDGAAASAAAPATAPADADSATGTDPFASAPTTAPSSATADAGDDSAAPTSQPSEGRSVSNSEVSVNDAGTVEIHVNDANLVEVLRMLSLQSQKNIIASKDVHGTVTANLYDVTVREALDAILHANGYGYREKGNFIYVYTAKEIADMERAERHMETRVFTVYYTPAANAQNVIKPLLSPTGQVAVSTPSKVGISPSSNGGGGNDFAGNDTLVVTDYPEVLDRIADVLKQVDKRPQQILLEATILSAKLHENNAMGVDFNIMGGVDMSGIVNSAGQIVGSGVTDTTSTTPATLTDGSAIPQGRAHSVGTGNSFTSPIAGGLKVGFVTNSASIFLAALEQTTDATVLANPKVLALNKQQGEIQIGGEFGYKTSITTETTTAQDVQMLDTGVHLLFRPFIGDDGYIRMEVHPEDSSGQVDPVTQLPSKDTTELTSNIMVKDGHTIVIGGLFRDATNSTRSQVPFLGNLPIVGSLFRNQQDDTQREEVIILLTPHIVKDDASYSKLSEDELKMAEDLRIGARKGLMPWGRERLAEGWYESARREMAKAHPDRKLAKWDLDAATNLYPTFSEAIEMKEQITGHEVTDADGSSIRSFVRRAIMSDVVPATQPANSAMNDGSDDSSAASPSTKPSDDQAAEAPATQPSEDQAAEAPATQPAVAEDESGSGAATQPSDATASTDDPSDSNGDDEAMSQDDAPQQGQAMQDSASAPDATATATGQDEANGEAPAEPNGAESSSAEASVNDQSAAASTQPSAQPQSPADSTQSASAAPTDSTAAGSAPATQPSSIDGSTAQTDQSPVIDQPSEGTDSSTPQQ